MFSIGVSFFGEKQNYCLFYACYNGVAIGGSYPGYDGLLRALHDIRLYIIFLQNEKAAKKERAEIDEAVINRMKKRLLEIIFDEISVIKTLADDNSEFIILVEHVDFRVRYIYNKTNLRLLLGDERDTIDELIQEQAAQSIGP